jgi:hypothetical protein
VVIVASGSRQNVLIRFATSRSLCTPTGIASGSLPYPPHDELQA